MEDGSTKHKEIKLEHKNKLPQEICENLFQSADIKNFKSKL